MYHLFLFWECMRPLAFSSFAPASIKKLKELVTMTTIVQLKPPEFSPLSSWVSLWSMRRDTHFLLIFWECMLPFFGPSKFESLTWLSVCVKCWLLFSMFSWLLTNSESMGSNQGFLFMNHKIFSIFIVILKDFFFSFFPHFFPLQQIPYPPYTQSNPFNYGQGPSDLTKYSDSATLPLPYPPQHKLVWTLWSLWFEFSS